jgi:hypothetical protein
MDEPESWESLYEQGTLTDEMDAVDSWLSAFVSGNSPTKALLLLGPSGCGKTTVAKLGLAKWGYAIQELPAFHVRNKKYMSEQLDNCLVHSSLIPSKRRAVLVDSIESMLPSESLGVIELIKYVSVQSIRKKRTIVQTSRDVPVICVCNPGNHKKDTLTHLKTECTPVEFGAHVQEVCKRRLGSHEHLAKVVGISGLYDVRKALQTIQLLQHAHEDEDEEEEQEEEGGGGGGVLEILGSKHQTQYIVRAVETVLCGASAPTAKNPALSPLQLQGMFVKDRNKFLPMMHENYYQSVCLMPHLTEREKLRVTVRLARLFVLADVLDRNACHQATYGVACVQCPCSILEEALVVAKKQQQKQGVHGRRQRVVWARLLQVRSQSQNVKKSLVALSNAAFPTKLASVWEVQHAIAVTMSLLLCGKYDKMAAYADKLRLIPPAEELGASKDPLEVVRKLNKYVKLHPVYTKFADFCQQNKSNKQLMQRLRSAFRAQATKNRLAAASVANGGDQSSAVGRTSQGRIVQQTQRLTALFGS